MTLKNSTDRVAGSAHRARDRREPLGPDLQRFAHEQLAMALTHLARTGDDRHEGVHEARKCLRRTRASLAMGAKPWRRAVAASDLELHRICRGLSSVRDAQALVESVQRLDGQQGLTPDIYLRSLAAATQHRDDVMSQALRRDEAFARRRERIARIGRRLAALDWNAVDTQAALAALKRSERRVRRARRRAMASPDGHARWHTYRRRLRRLRQQIGVLDAIAPELAHGLDRCAEQATMLGELQDDSLLLARCAGRSPFPGDCRGALRRISRSRLSRRTATAA